MKIEKYEPILDIYQTQMAIKQVKDSFQVNLAKALNLKRVTAPLFVTKDSGLNDNLSGKERPVNFSIKNIDKDIEIVQSLAKWKRYALKKYDFHVYNGLYTDMNAIRRDEDLDNIHSVYVDQWDWEKVINKTDRNLNYLKKTVRLIYKALIKTNNFINKKYPSLNSELPKQIHFVFSQDLETMYPSLQPKEREYEITKLYKAVFIIGIGNNLKSGKPHDIRAADYDDWNLNGDLLLYFETLDIALEISSMGIRVDKEALVNQLSFKNELDKLSNPYCESILNDTLPQTIGGGIGQSRLCMFFLKKRHIGEVQVSIWDEEYLNNLEKENIKLL